MRAVSPVEGPMVRCVLVSCGRRPILAKRPNRAFPVETMLAFLKQGIERTSSYTVNLFQSLDEGLSVFCFSSSALSFSWRPGPTGLIQDYPRFRSMKWRQILELYRFVKSVSKHFACFQ